jgi:hypothetical protein
MNNCNCNCNCHKNNVEQFSSIKKYNRQPYIEHFKSSNNMNYNNKNGKLYEHMAGIANSTNIAHYNKQKVALENNINLNKSQSITQMAKIITKVSNDVAQSNSTDIINSVTASNHFIMENVGGDDPNAPLIINGMNMDASTDVSITAEVNQSTINTIKNEITKGIKSELSRAIEEVKTNMTGTDIGDMVTGAIGIVGQLGEAAVEVIGDTMLVLASSGIANDTNYSDTNITENEIKNNFNLDASFKLDDTMEQEDVFETVLNQEQFSKCMNNMTAENKIEFRNITKGAIILTDINMTAKAKVMIQCVMNQTVVNEIAQKIVNRIDETVKNMLKYTDVEKSGDILALGEAASQTIDSAGTAASEVIDSSGEAAAGVIGAVSSNIMFIIGGGILVLFFIVGALYIYTSSGGELPQGMMQRRF